MIVVESSSLSRNLNNFTAVVFFFIKLFLILFGSVLQTLSTGKAQAERQHACLELLAAGQNVSWFLFEMMLLMVSCTIASRML